jgi:LysR family transcriptional regulator, nitrogen assimilation regulatory protein
VINRYGTGGMRGEEVFGTADTYLIARSGHQLLAAPTLQLRALAGVPLVLPATPQRLARGARPSGAPPSHSAERRDGGG